MWPWGLGAGSQATSGWAVGGTVVTVVGGWEESLDGRMVVVRISLADGGGGMGWVVRRTGVPREVLAGALCPWPVSPAVGRRLRKGPGQGGPAPEAGVRSMPILPGPALSTDLHPSWAPAALPRSCQQEEGHSFNKEWTNEPCAWTPCCCPFSGPSGRPCRASGPSCFCR